MSSLISKIKENGESNADAARRVVENPSLLEGQEPESIIQETYTEPKWKQSRYVKRAKHLLDKSMSTYLPLGASVLLVNGAYNILSGGDVPGPHFQAGFIAVSKTALELNDRDHDFIPNLIETGMLAAGIELAYFTGNYPVIGPEGLENAIPNLYNTLMMGAYSFLGGIGSEATTSFGVPLTKSVGKVIQKTGSALEKIASLYDEKINTKRD